MTKTALTLLEYALLGLLDGEPASGYDVKRIFDSTPLAHFSSSPGAIYPALKRLEKRGLLSPRLDTTTETRPRRVYSVTDEGRAALTEWLRQPVTRDELVRNGKAPMLRFALAEGRLTPDEVAAYLEGLGQVLEEYLRQLYRHRADVAQPGVLHARLALEDGIRGYEGFAQWVKWAIGEIRARVREMGRTASEAAPTSARAESGSQLAGESRPMNTQKGD